MQRKPNTSILFIYSLNYLRNIVSKSYRNRKSDIEASLLHMDKYCRSCKERLYGRHLTVYSSSSGAVVDSSADYFHSHIITFSVCSMQRTYHRQKRECMRSLARLGSTGATLFTASIACVNHFATAHFGFGYRELILFSVNMLSRLCVTYTLGHRKRATFVFDDNSGVS